LGNIEDDSRKDHDQDKLKPATAMPLRQLERAPLFNRLPTEELEYLASRLRVLEIPPGTVLFSEGEAGSHFYVVIYGEMEIIKALGTEDERLLAIRGPGEFVGELSLLNPNGLRTASVRSRGPSHLWEITHVEVDALLTRQPQVAYDMMHMISDRLSESQDAVFMDLRERNRQLTQAYQEVIEAQEQIVEKEKLERELHVAYEIQMSILPQTLPTVKGYDFGARVQPARAVGGDFYDIFPLPDNRIGVAIGDVADKGVPSAIFMARTHAFLLAEAGHCSHPTEALRRVNRHLFRNDQPSLFVTVLFGILDMNTSVFSYARAGHELPLIMNSEGVPYLASYDQGQLLGFFEEPQIDEQTVCIPAGGMILLYTDGLTDGRRSNGEAFGYDRLLDVVRSFKGETAQAVCDRLLEHLFLFQEGIHQDDDVTLVALCRK
jgi:phosphoserine phosphatase RsbU/P